MKRHKFVAVEFCLIFIDFVIFSGPDGDPEYLSDLERQIIQRNRLRQV